MKLSGRGFLALAPMEARVPAGINAYQQSTYLAIANKVLANTLWNCCLRSV